MSPKLDLTGIAERIRSLIGHADDKLAPEAARLGVDATSLSRSISLGFPHPSVSVLTAIVRQYGVDPTWLVYGDYDPTTHGIASEIGNAITNDDVLKLIDSPKRKTEQEGPRDRLESQLRG